MKLLLLLFIDGEKLSLFHVFTFIPKKIVLGYRLYKLL